MVEFAVTGLMEVSHAGLSFFLISFRPLKQLKVISPEFTHYGIGVTSVTAKLRLWVYVPLPKPSVQRRRCSSTFLRRANAIVSGA